MAQHSAVEQYLLELINRARLDPLAEAARYGVDLNQGLSSGTISGAAKQPLAGNTDLAQASESHSEWMLATNTFSHYGPGGSSPGDRMKAAGYDFTGSWTWGENISWRGTTGSLNLKSAADSQHSGLFKSAGHRANMLNNYFREGGLGVETGSYNGYNAAMTTEGFAKSGNAFFLTGVVFDDQNGDDFYTPGEGSGGVSVRIGSQTVKTAAAGGYEAKVGGSGAYAVNIGGVNVTVTMAASNAKLDLFDAGSIASSVSFKLGSGGKHAKLLGVANLDAEGNGAANTIEGNRGNNEITGGDGADTMTGGGGKDTYIIRKGDADGDWITDFSSNDFVRFEGYNPNAALISEGGGQWRVSDGNEQLKISGSFGSGKYGFYESVDTGTPTPPAPDIPPTPEPDPEPEPDTPPSTPPAPTPDSDGINGTNASETLRGTATADLIRGKGGSDKLVGKDGNDTLDGGAGSDTLIGNAGNDLLIMDNGDTGKGGSGSDTHEVSLGNNHSVLIRGFSVSSDQVVLDTGFAVTSAFYKRIEDDGDGRFNDMELILKGGGKTASIVFEDRYGALRKDAGLSSSKFADGGEVALPGDFDDFAADHDWIEIA